MKRKPKKSKPDVWEQKFLMVVPKCHKRNLPQVVKKIITRVKRTKHSLVARSKKYNVPCEVTNEQLFQLVYDYYGNQCKYCTKIISINNLVFDHIIPISKNGSSNIDNLQIICKTSNGMKGSLSEEHFGILRDWLKTVPEELSKDISIRLSKGIH